MMMGTPGRPGITMTGALSAKAVDVVAIKSASANAARIISGPNYEPYPNRTHQPKG
jgi:hypothetical protein